MLIFELDLANLTFSLALKGVPNLAIRTLCSVRDQFQRIRLPFTASSRSRCHRRVRYNPHMKARRCTSRSYLKTSFSRSVRGCAVRQHPSTCRQRKSETPKSPKPESLEVSMVQQPTTNMP